MRDILKFCNQNSLWRDSIFPLSAFYLYVWLSVRSRDLFEGGPKCSGDFWVLTPPGECFPVSFVRGLNFVCYLGLYFFVVAWIIWPCVSETRPLPTVIVWLHSKSTRWFTVRCSMVYIGLPHIRSFNKSSSDGVYSKAIMRPLETR